MIRFSPKNRDLTLALMAVDHVAHESPVWFVPVGDGVHVDVRASSDVQLISIRVASVDPVTEAATSLCIEHYGMHPLGSLASSGQGDLPMLFKSNSKVWSATNEFGTITGNIDPHAQEPDWDVWMVPPLEPGVLVDPELLGDELTVMMGREVPALVAASGDGKSLVFATEHVSLWTLGMDKDVVGSIRKHLVN